MIVNSNSGLDRGWRKNPAGIYQFWDGEKFGVIARDHFVKDLRNSDLTLEEVVEKANVIIEAKASLPPVVDSAYATRAPLQANSAIEGNHSDHHKAVNQPLDRTIEQPISTAIMDADPVIDAPPTSTSQEYTFEPVGSLPDGKIIYTRLGEAPAADYSPEKSSVYSLVTADTKEQSFGEMAKERLTTGQIILLIIAIIVFLPIVIYALTIVASIIFGLIGWAISFFGILAGGLFSLPMSFI